MFGAFASPPCVPSLGDNLIDAGSDGELSAVGCVFVEFVDFGDDGEEDGKMFVNQLLALITPPSTEPTLAPGFWFYKIIKCYSPLQPGFSN